MDKNILIVGAGPVGLSLSVELVRRGYRPHLIDKGSGPTPESESRALAVHLRTLDIFKPSGISQELLDQGNLITNIEILQDGRKFARMDLAKHPRKDSAILSIPQGTTERVLLRWLGKHDIVPQWNSELVKLDVGDEISTAIIKTNGEKTTQLDCHIIAGCDGAHSQVRKSAGINFAGRTESGQWSLVDVNYKTELDPHTGRPNFITGGGVFVSIPINKHLVRCFSSSPDILDLIPNKEDIKALPWQSTFKISYRVVETFQKNNIFLAGDAAHIHSPAGGRGMNLGIEDAAWLAWLISEERTNEYSSYRLPVAQKTIRETFAVTDQITNDNSVGRLIRTVVFPAMLKIPPLRTRILNSMLALDTPPPPWLN